MDGQRRATEASDRGEGARRGTEAAMGLQVGAAAHARGDRRQPEAQVQLSQQIPRPGTALPPFAEPPTTYRTSGAEATQGHEWAAALGPGSFPPTSAPGIALTAATSAPGLRSPLPHLHWDWAHPGHICTRIALTAATSAPGPGTPICTGAGLIPAHICTGTGLRLVATCAPAGGTALAPATSAPGLRSLLPHQLWE